MEHKEYYFTKVLSIDFNSAIDKVTGELKKEGFGILTEIDVKATMKDKLDVEFRNYKILGACNPPYAFKAISSEDKIGTMLPCNIVVQEHQPGKVEVTAVDPIASMMAIQNRDLEPIVLEVQGKLKRVIENL